VYVATSGRVIDSVLMDKVQVGAGAVINRAILDKNVKVPAGAAIGLDHDLDRARGFKVTESGITVLSKGQEVPEPGEEERQLAARHLSLLPSGVKAAAEQYPDFGEAADKVAGTHAATAAKATPGARVS